MRIDETETRELDKSAIVGAVYRAVEVYPHQKKWSETAVLELARPMLIQIYGQDSPQHPRGVRFLGVFAHVFKRAMDHLGKKSYPVYEMAELCWATRDREKRMQFVEHFLESLESNEFQSLFGVEEETQDETERMDAVESEFARYAFSSALWSAIHDYPDGFVEEEDALEKASGYVLNKYAQENFEMGVLLSYLPFQHTFQDVFVTFYKLFRDYLQKNLQNIREMVEYAKGQKNAYEEVVQAVFWMDHALPEEDPLFLQTRLFREKYGSYLLPPLTAADVTVDFFLELPKDMHFLKRLAAGHVFFNYYINKGLLVADAEGLSDYFFSTYQGFKESQKAQYPEKRFTNDEVLARTTFVQSSVRWYQELQIAARRDKNLMQFYKTLDGLPQEEAFGICMSAITRSWDGEGDSPWPTILPNLPFNNDISLWEPEKDEEPECLFPGCKKPAAPLIKISIQERTRNFDMYVQSCDEHREQLLERCSRERLNYIVRSMLYKMGLDGEGATFKTVRYVAPAKPSSRYMKERSLMERYRMRNREVVLQMERFRRIPALFGDSALLFAGVTVDAEVDLARKFEFAPSAVALVEYLPKMKAQEALEKANGYAARVWIRFEQPIAMPHGVVHALCFGMKDDLDLEYAQSRYPVSKATYEKLAEYLHEPRMEYEAALDAIAEDGKVVWTQSFYQWDASKDELLSAQNAGMKICGNQECLERDDAICETCFETNALYWSLYANCLRLIRGELAEEDPGEDQERKKLPVKKEVVERNEPDPARMHKFKRNQITHTISVVTYNALVKKQPTPKEHVPRGSWTAKIDPEQITYWREEIHYERGRALKHPRYWNYIRSKGVDPEDPNFQGYTIEVQDHWRWQPMKLSTLRDRLTRVVAEKKKPRK